MALIASPRPSIYCASLCTKIFADCYGDMKSQRVLVVLEVFIIRILFVQAQIRGELYEHLLFPGLLLDMDSIDSFWGQGWREQGQHKWALYYPQSWVWNGIIELIKTHFGFLAKIQQ